MVVVSLEVALLADFLSRSYVHVSSLSGREHKSRDCLSSCISYNSVVLDHIGLFVYGTLGFISKDI